MLDTGICHAKGSPKRYMYNAGPTQGNIMDSPVRVWEASGGTVEEMTLREFNRLYVVDYRFDTSRMPVSD